MTMFKATVGVRPFVKRALGTSTAAELPNHLDLGDVVLDREAGGNRHLASLNVDAPSPAAAREQAVARIREVLVVLATSGDAYEVAFGPMPQVQEGSAAAQVTTTDGGSTVAAPAVVSTAAQVDVVVRRADYSKQAAAVAASSMWPTWLRVALELNYLGATARYDRPGLVSHCSALEVIVHGTQGPPRALPKAVLGDDASKELGDDLLAWLQTEGLEEKQATRVTAQAMNAHLEGTLDRTQRALAQLGVEVSVSKLKKVSKARGSVVHAEEQPSDAQVVQALGAVQGWLRPALSASSSGTPSRPSRTEQLPASLRGGAACTSRGSWSPAAA